ncbi:MAG: rod shape-determining protein [Oscillospiraceae bacterium]|jgi:rod shape-determining protein MreB|nr:rod shape-determining protein [Oscillospiraceae bacterium]
MGILSPDIGVDLGSSSVVLYVTGKGIVLREPSLVVVRNDVSREALAIGEEARAMLGRMPGDLIAVHPILQGVIADFELTVLMLKYFLRLAIGVNRLGKPRAVVAIPGEITEMERRAVEEAFRMSGFRSVRLVEAAVAAAHGSGLPVYDPQGSLVVDIGGGTAECAVLSMGDVVVGRSDRQAGMAWDEAVAAYVKKTSNLLIGDRTAEEVKIDLGGAAPVKEPRRSMVRGRDLVTGLPQTIELTSEQVYEALREPMRQVLGLLTWTLERTPPELAVDVVRSGVHLTGGGSLLPGLDQMLANELGIPAQVARSPMDCVALGAGYLATNLELLSRIGKNHPLTE